jgi:NhaA family Na+:H+ antiporter
MPAHGSRQLSSRRLRTPGGLWHFGAEHFLLLPLGALIALVWANTLPESYFRMAGSLSFAVNEVGMALFLALVTQEVFEATMKGGALHTWRRWVLPLVAASGGAIASVLAYLTYVNLAYEVLLEAGWPVACAIDVGFGYFIIKGIFGRHPALSFYLLLALSLDAVAIFAIALRPGLMDTRPGGAGLVVVAIGLAAILRAMGVRRFWPYLCICGPLSWWGLFRDGLHPALALVPIVPILPHTPRSADVFADAPHSVPDSPRYSERLWTYAVQPVLFLFGLVNAGVQPLGYETGTWAVIVAALIARPLGVGAAVGLAVALGLHLPARLRWREVAVVALASASGFTFGLFVATAVFPRGPVLAQLKIGVLLTSVGALLALGAARLLHVGRFGQST